MTVYNLDGVDNSDTYTNVSNSYPNPDAVQAMVVETNNFSAESGRRAGGVVDVITKSGTNQFHGSAFFFLRNYALDATNYFTPGKPDFLKRNQYGGSVGGPIRKNKTFFFFDFQRTTLRQNAQYSTVIVPTAKNKQGDFSNIRGANGAPVQLTNPYTGQPFPNNQIPTTLFDPIAMGVLKYIPTATNADGSLLIATPENNSDNQYIARVDQQITNSNRLSGRVVVDKQNGGLEVDPANILTASFKVNYHSYNISLQDVETFSPHLLGVFSATLNRLYTNSGGSYPTTFHDLGANIVNLTPFKTMEVAVTNYFSLPRLDPVILARNNYQYQASFSYERGAHELKFGADIMRQQLNVPIAALVSNGLFIFSAATSGSNLTDFMLGNSNYFIQSTGWSEAMRATQPGFYLQDNYSLRKHLTIDMGVRWEPYLPWTELHNKTLKFLPGVQSTVAPDLPVGLVVAGEAGVPRAGQNSAITKFAPRLGFAYVLPDTKTVVRGGYGIFFDFPNAIINNRFASNIPFTVRVDVVPPTSMKSPWTAAQPNPFPTKVPPPSGFVFPRPAIAVTYDDNFTNGYLQQWNLTLERQFPKDWVARASYAGSKGTKLMALEELNPAVYIPGKSTLTNIDSRRPYAPEFGSIQSLVSNGNSSYNALILSLNKKYSRGYEMHAAYTFGKSLDCQSDVVAQGQGVYTNPSDFKYDHGLSDFNVTSQLVGDFQYLLPFFQKKDANRFARDVLGNWQVNSIFMFHSGTPLTVYSGIYQRLDGIYQDRPDLVGNPKLDTGRSKEAKIKEYFNTSAFQLEALGTYGTAGRNIVTGPGYAGVDLSLFKSIPFKERYDLQFRAEAFNAFNRTNFFAPNATLASPLFGQITTANSARIMQLALRLTF